MTKNQTVELLKKQLPGYYSADQVINLINEIEDVSQDLVVERALRDMYSDDLVDLESAEFSLSGNEISLDSVDANEDQIKERVTEAVREALLDYFPAPKQLETA
jgi:hypothetical protein